MHALINSVAFSEHLRFPGRELSGTVTGDERWSSPDGDHCLLPAFLLSSNEDVLLRLAFESPDVFLPRDTRFALVKCGKFLVVEDLLEEVEHGDGVHASSLDWGLLSLDADLVEDLVVIRLSSSWLPCPEGISIVNCSNGFPFSTSLLLKT
jgi:hypothetical protein